jgi:hypothetical protein
MMLSHSIVGCLQRSNRIAELQVRDDLLYIAVSRNVSPRAFFTLVYLHFLLHSLEMLFQLRAIYVMACYTPFHLPQPHNTTIEEALSYSSC